MDAISNERTCHASGRTLLGETHPQIPVGQICQSRVPAAAAANTSVRTMTLDEPPGMIFPCGNTRMSRSGDGGSLTLRTRRSILTWTAPPYAHVR